MKKYIIRLTQAEREQLRALVRNGKAAAYRITHANILLKADADGPGWIDKGIAEAFGCHVRTVENVRRRCVLEGLQAALERKKQARPRRQRKLDGEGEARLVALACSEAPKGRTQWTLRMLAEKMVALEYVERLSHETVRQVLKKRNQALAL